MITSHYNLPRDMHFDHESTVVITKINNLSESVLTTYCQNFGKILRCFIKPPMQTRNKESYALIKFADPSSVTSILNNRNHTINGTHVVMRSYHQDTNNSVTLPSLMSLSQQNQIPPNPPNNINGQNTTHYDQLMQENLSLKCEIGNLQRSLAETQIYSNTAYDAFQALREKYASEQALTNQLKLEYKNMVESYEARLKELSSSSSLKTIKEEPIDCDSRKGNSPNYSLEMQVMKDRLEQAQIDLGKCQTENAILNAKLLSREQQSDIRYKELNNQFIRLKKHYDHMSSCIKDFHSKLYQRKKLKTDVKDGIITKADGENTDTNDDIIEVPMQIEP